MSFDDAEPASVMFADFMTLLRKNVDLFESYWIRNNAAAPDNYPNEMWKGDWSEQFLCFDEDAD